MMCAISSQTATGFRLAAPAHLCTAPGESRPRLLLFAIKSLFATKLHFCNKTYIFETKPKFLQQDLHFYNKTYIFATRNIFLQQDIHFCNKTYIFVTRPSFLQQDFKSLNKAFCPGLCTRKTTHQHQKWKWGL